MESRIQIKFTVQERKDILVTAVEGGINYWIVNSAEDYTVCRDEDLYVTSLKVVHEEIHNDLNGNYRTINCNYGTLDTAANKILSGFVKAPGTKNQLERSVKSDDLDLDAEAADVLVQVCLFGEIVYG